jgi:hypothetical protein
MQTTQDTEAAPGYNIWGIDAAAYGPIELPVLVNWIKEERVIADTWIFVERECCWLRACEVAELKMFFRPKRDPASRASLDPEAQIEPGALRRIKALAEMTDDQLAALLTFIEIEKIRPFTHVVRKGEPGDTMYGVLQGELRSCVMVDGKECPLATLGPGSVFGEISLFDRGPHAADVIANEESLVVKISATALARTRRSRC